MIDDRMPLIMFQAFTQQLFARQVLAAASAVPIVHQPPPVTSPHQVAPPPPPPPLPPLAPLQHPLPQKSPQLNGNCSPRRVPTPNKSVVGFSAHIEQKENFINFKTEPMNIAPSVGEEHQITSTPPPLNGEALNFSVSLGDLILNPVEDIKDDNPEFICFAA